LGSYITVYIDFGKWNWYGRSSRKDRKKNGIGQIITLERYTIQKSLTQAHRNVLTVKIPDKKKISMQTMDNLEAINSF
jgi:hypothetical protein